MAIGAGALASGVGDVAVGADAKVQSGALYGDGGALGSVAMGSNAKAQAASASAFGGLANASGPQATAIGSHASASGASSFAGGYGAAASGSTAVAIGGSSTAAGTDSIAIGDGVKSAQNSAVSIGSQLTNNAANSIVIGSNGSTLDAASTQTVLLAPNTGSVANSANSFVFNPYGGTSTTGSNDSINLGGTVANAAGGVAVGSKSSVTASNAVALGAGSVADQNNTVSVGSATQQRKITNVQAGDVSASSTDAVNGSQLYSTNSNVTTLNNSINQVQQRIKYLAANDASGSVAGASVTGAGSIAIGGNAVATSVGGTDAAIAIGSDSRALVSKTLALGAASTVSAHDSVALGTYSVADRTSTVSVGSATSQRQIVNVAAGTQDTDVANIEQLKSTGLKLDANGNATNALVAYDDTALGSVTLAGADGTTITNLKAGDLSAGSTDAVNGSQLFATNQNLAALSQDAVKYDSSAHDLITLGNAGTPVQLTNVKAGALTDTSTDAVNGSQLSATNQNVAALSQDAVKYDSSAHDLITLGNAGTPVQLTNVKAGALTATSTDAVNGSQLFAMSQGMAALSQNAVTYDSSAHDLITLGNAGTPVQLTNVKAGALTDTSTDAVNGAQLYATNQTVAKNTTDIGNLTTTVNNWTNDVETGQVGLVRQDLVTRNLTIGAATDGASIDLSGTAGPRAMTGVANGAVNAASTDAINGAQLYAASASTAAALGGGTGVDANGAMTAPSYSVGGTTVNNVGAAIENLDGRVTQNTSDIAALQGGLADVSAVARNAVAYDSADRTKVTLGGAASDGSTSAPVQLTNVKNGELSATSTDAVNGSQLYATNTKLDKYAGIVDDYQQAGVGYVAVNSSNAPRPTASGADAIAIGAGTVAAGNNSIALGANASATGNNAIALGSNSTADQDNTMSVGSAGNERRVTNVAPGVGGTDAVNMNQMNALRNDFGSSMRSLQRSSFAGVAAAMAMPVYTPREPGHTVVSASVGTYKGYSAMGLGVTYRSRDGGLLVNGSMSVTPYGDTGARASVAYDF